MTFHAETERTGRTAVVHMHGELNASADTELFAAHAAAVADGSHDVLLDFGDVDYINSSGIALIVALLTDAQQSGRRLHATGLSDHYRHIFEITRLTDYLVLDAGGSRPAAHDAPAEREEEATHG